MLKPIALGMLMITLVSWNPSTPYASTVSCERTAVAAGTKNSAKQPLPEREGVRIRTSGAVPHVQLDAVLVESINELLVELAFTLPGVEARPTRVSLPGALGMWLSEEIKVERPKAIVSGREFAHIHPDGSLHAPLPKSRALELERKGWGERHPWADQNDGWEGFVMLYTPQSMDELEITFQLIVESYNHVTGQELVASDYK